MEHSADTVDLATLAAQAGVSVRTIRYYVQSGLLPAPYGRGPGAHYGRGHLARLRLIRLLQERHLPLAAIRAQLDAMDDAAVEAALATQPPPATAPASALEYIRAVLESAGDAPPPRGMAAPLGSVSAAFDVPPRLREAPVARETASSVGGAPHVEVTAGYQRATWERYTLAPDIELHVRRPLTREQQRRIDRLLDLAARLFQEDA